jgi:DNA-binding response OmpR family regulator
MIPHRARTVTILLVDDDASDGAPTQAAFEEANQANDLRLSLNCAELLDYLYRRGKYAEPTASPGPVLLDLDVPCLDGRETPRQTENHDERGS